MACIWETAESHAHGFRSLLLHCTPMESAGMEDLLSFLGECTCVSYVGVCHMTDIFPNRISDGGGPLRQGNRGHRPPDGCLGTEFNLLIVLRGSAGAQEPARAESPTKACPGLGQRRSPRARLWQINLVVLDERCAAVCRTRTTMQYPAEFHLLA